jgi:hypothetical protein
METSAEFGLSNQKPMPWWIGKIASLRGLWYNPVFQRNYQRSRIKRIVEPKTALYAGLIWSVLMNLMVIVFILTGVIKDNELSESTYLFILSAPLDVIIIITFIRMFIVCLISTTIEIKKDIISENQSPVLSTPLKDSELYLAQCLPDCIRGLDITVSAIAFGIGVLISGFICAIPLSLMTNASFTEFLSMAGLVPLSIIHGSFDLVFMMYFLSLTAGLYSIQFPAVPAIFATIIHFGVVWVIANIMPLLGIVVSEVFFNLNFIWQLLFESGFYSNPMDRYGDISIGSFLLAQTMLTIFSLVIKSMVIGLFAYITLILGQSEFSKMRRAGYYLPELTTADNLEDFFQADRI